MTPGRAGRPAERLRRALLPGLAGELDADSRDALGRDLAGLGFRSVILVLLLPLGGQLVQVLGGGDLHVAAVRSAASLGLVLSLAYVTWGRGRSPLALIAWPEAMARALLVALAFLAGNGSRPDGATAVTAVTAVICVAHALGTLPIPFLSAVYGAVYPARLRGRLIAHGRMVFGVAGIAAAYVFGRLLQHDASLYRVIYPAAGVAGVLATIYFCRMQAPAARTAEDRRGPSAWRVLRDDGAFLRFQAFQFLLGFANLAAIPVIDVHVRQDMGLPIHLAVLVVGQGIVAQALTLLTVRFQGRLFDRIGVVRLRVWTSLLMATGFVAWAVAGSLAVAVVAAALIGLGMAGGQLIWIVGSLHFAPPGQMSTYSGIHTFLTGVRGLLAPLAGVWALGALAGDHRTFFLVTALLIVVSAAGHGWTVREPAREAGPPPAPPPPT